MGNVVFISLAIGIALILLQVPISALLAKTVLQIGTARDARLSLMNSILQGIENIKCYSLE